MTWQESEHPRDEDGKFTFKNGEGSTNNSSNLESNTYILYGKAIKNEQDNKVKSSIKNKLLNILGNKATRSDVLYGTQKSLIKKIKDNGLEKFLEGEKANRIKIKANKLLGNNARNIANNWKGIDTTGMLDIASNKKNLEYSKNAIVLKNVDVFKEKSELYKFKTYMKDKIKTQFKDYNYDINDIKGYVFEKDSPQVQRIKESEGFKKIIKENKQNILNKKDIFSGRFIQDYNNKKEINMYNAFAGVDIINQGIDKDGNLRLYMFDTYDFNRGESPLVEAGRKEMLNGTLKGFFSLHEIVLDKKELNEIFR